MRITIGQPPALNLAGLADEVRREVLLTMQAGMQIIANDAKRAVANPPKSGRIYSRRGITHQASAPGEAPATDTGALIASIRAGATLDGEKIEGVIEARMPYAVWLEYGTRKMQPRPFLTPAIEGNRSRIATLLQQALATATARFAKKR